jgi:hypothetical protein
MAQLGTGTSISFATGFLAEVLDVRPPAGSRGKVDTTHMLTENARTNMPTKLVEWGECEMDIHFQPGVDPPLKDEEETITITFPDGETWEFTGWMSRFEPSVPLEDKMTATVAIQVNGDVTIEGGSS